MRPRAVVATCAAVALTSIAGAAALSSISGAATFRPTDPKCFGAAVRDKAHPCSNPTRKAYPPWSDSDRLPDSPCQPTRQRPEPVCTFGVSAGKARRTIALIGDSHALHWRAALDVVAKRSRWRGYSLTAPACFYSDAVDDLPDGLRQPCQTWFRSVKAWLKRHREVSIVFVSQKVDTPVTIPPGKTYADVRTAGFRSAWRRLPKSVKHLVVIRDTPMTSTASRRCVGRVVAARKRRPGPACSVPRSAAVVDDTAVAAVKQLPSKRFGFVDLTDFFCGPRSCYPVLGGVLIYYDDLGHITRAYSRSLGPYLLRRVRGLQVKW